MRVAYTLEQCWHRVPGGTAVAALRIARELAAGDEVTVVGVAGRHGAQPPEPWVPPVPVVQLPLAAPWLYETWLRARWPKVERATGAVDVAHATTVIPCPSDAPLVCTIHDLAFVHEPEHFTRHGVRVFERSLNVLRARAALVLCSSEATAADCRAAGLPPERLRVVPLGVDATAADEADVARIRAAYGLPARFALFVGTIEPRKNLANLAVAARRVPDLPLVVAGADGWGGTAPPGDARFLGFVPEADLAGLYAAATVFCYPSIREGYGLPVLEAMVQGTPVVTSRGTSTEEAAGGAAVLVDPYDPGDIARGIAEALDRAAELSAVGRTRAAGQTWARAAELTVAAYREAAA
ncbi:MAG: glycosyltransferase family 1 protein [Ilumatobacteraceae bacterium]